MVNIIPTKEEWNKALCARHGSELQNKFSDATIAICGLGGLGSNIAIALARTGIGRLILIDFDHVDITNLHRQQYKANQVGQYKTDALAENLREIAPYIEFEKHNVRITKENIIQLLQKADVICEAFDDEKCKAELVNTVLEQMPDKYIIAATGMSGICSANSIRTRKITNKFYLCGDEVSDVNISGLFATRVMICAAHQAHMVLRILAEIYDDI